MSDTPNINRLLILAHRLVALLQDPHPGLSTWIESYGRTVRNITEFWDEPPQDI